mgnify:CR=1 FL=1
MIETLLTFIKTLPHWLASIVEILLVAVVFSTAVTFLVGIWCGMRIIGRRASSIKEIDFFPPKIIFKENETPNQ